LLPSEALERASTFDLYVLDVSSRWVKYQQDMADSKQKGVAPPPAKNLSQQQMMDMIKRARERQKNA
jgi:hypothetical protein